MNEAVNSSSRAGEAPSTELSTREQARRAKMTSRVLAPLSEDRRNAALEAMASALWASIEELLNANALDLRKAGALRDEDALAPATLARLKLDADRIGEMVAQVRSVAALPDPLGRVLDAVELDSQNPPAQERPSDAGSRGLHLQKVSVPLGVLAVIFEARPDAVSQIASLALKSGNAVLLKPGREVEHTAIALVNVLRQALRGEGMPDDAVQLVLGRERAAELLQMHDLVDLVIPRGSSALVRYVQANTQIPVLGHAEGICHIYVDRCFSPSLALRVIEDAKTDYPAACNAVETVLVHRESAPAFLPLLAQRLQGRGVSLHVDEAVRTLLERGSPAVLTPESELVKDWHTEYGELAISLGIVDSLEAAIDHIHTHGSLHTESIITDDAEAAERFLREVDAAGVFHNASTRFADGFRYGFGAEVGVSTSKFHARGPVGLEGLTTYKYLLRGHGHIAGEYRGPQARAFTHRRG